MSEEAPVVRSNRRWWILGGALAAAVVVVLVIAFFAGNGPTPVAPSPSASPGASESATASPDPNPSESATPLPPVADPPRPEQGPWERAPIGLDETATVLDGVYVTLTSIAAVDGQAVEPGEVAGPALRVTVLVSNDTDASFDLTGTVVNLYYGTAQTPGLSLREPGGENFPASIDARGTASGAFVFTVPPEERDLVRITIDYSADHASLVFEGAAPR